jgi:hypothetical protein
MAKKPFRLNPDDPQARAVVLERLIKNGADDLVDMLGVKTPIPFYGSPS